MTYLLLSVAALAFGPLVHRYAAGARPALVALDGFVFVAVSGLVLFKLLPHSVAVAGYSAVGAAAIGFFALNAIERVVSHHGHGPGARRVRAVGLTLAAIGVASHELLDGVALATAQAQDAHAHVLPLAVILHRLPIGMALWWLVRPGYGRLAGWAALSAVGLATAIGYALGGRITAAGDATSIALLQGLVSGSLLHLALHRTEPGAHDDHDEPRHRRAATAGALAALALVIAMQEGDLASAPAAGELAAWPTLFALATMTAPWLVAAALLTALIQAISPLPALAEAQAGPTALGAAFRRVAPRAPAAALAALVAVPLLGLESVVLSVPLLGNGLAVARMIAAVAIAAAVALTLAPYAPPPEDDATSGEIAAGGWRRALRIGLLDLVDTAAPWWLAGLGIAAVIEPMLDPLWLTAVPAWAQILVAAAVGSAVHVAGPCALPIAAVLVHKGLAPGAALAFLITAPAVTAPVLRAIASRTSRRFAASFAVLVIACAIALGFLAQRVLGASVLPVHALAAAPLTPVEIASLASVAVLILISLFRQGPRGFVGRILPTHHVHTH